MLLKTWKINNYRKTISIIMKILLLLLVLNITGCVERNVGLLPVKTGSDVSPTNSETLLSPTSPDKKTATPTKSFTVITPTMTIDPLYDLRIKIDATQGPVNVSTQSVTGDLFLYEKAIVTVWLGNESDVFAYLNLDNLDDNGKTNSDIQIEMTTGSRSFYQLYPINNAVYFYTAAELIDYESCLQHFPLAGLTGTEYEGQALSFTTGNAYCVITNEGRLAIVNFVKDSITFNTDYSQTLSIQISVYDEILK